MEDIYPGGDANQKVLNEKKDDQNVSSDTNSSEDTVTEAQENGEETGKIIEPAESAEDTSAVVQAYDESSEIISNEAIVDETIQETEDNKEAVEQALDETKDTTADQVLDPVSEFLQQRKRRILIGLAIVAAAVVFLLAGWAYKNLAMNPAADDINYAKNTAFLLVANEEPDNLYMQIAGQNKESFFKNIIPSSVVYLRKSDRVLAVSKSGVLLIKETGRNQVTLSTKVVPGSVKVSADESSLLFLRNDKIDAGQRQGELYLLKLEGVNDKEKLSSDVFIGDYAVSADGNKALYISAADLFMTDGQEKIKLGSDVIYFNLNKSLETITFVNDRQELYVRQAESDYSDKIAAADTGLIFQDIRISDQGDYIAYIENYDVRKNSGELYLQNGLERKTLASDVKQYVVSFPEKQVHYLSDENELFVMGFDRDSKQRIAGNVDEFAMQGDRVIFTDKDYNIYAVDDDQDKVRIAGDVIDWMPAGDSLVFLNSDNCLMRADFKGNKEKINHDITAFSVLPTRTAKHTVIYYNQARELYVREGSQEQLKMKWNMDDYSKIYLLDQLFYERLLSLQDIAGIWQTEYGDGIIEFTHDGKCRYISQGIITLESDIFLYDPTPNEVDVFTDITNHDESNVVNYRLVRIDSSHLYVNGESYNKISAEALEKIKIEAINKKLQELEAGLELANQYNSIRVNYLNLVDQLNYDEISWYYFANTIDKARSDRIALYDQAIELKNSSYNPVLHEKLTAALMNAINYCEACYYAGDAYSQYLQDSYANDAANYANLLQQNLDSYQAVIKQEQEVLKAALPKE